MLEPSDRHGLVRIDLEAMNVAEDDAIGERAEEGDDADVDERAKK